MQATITKTGYRRNSPDVNNAVNIIPSNQISMACVDFSVVGVDNLGNYKVMKPEQNYVFKGDYVIEFPIRNNYNNMSGNNGWANQTGNSVCQGAKFGGSTGTTGTFQQGVGASLAPPPSGTNMFCIGTTTTSCAIPWDLVPPPTCASSGSTTVSCNAATQSFNTIENSIGQAIGLTPQTANKNTQNKNSSTIFYVIGGVVVVGVIITAIVLHNRGKGGKKK